MEIKTSLLTLRTGTPDDVQYLPQLVVNLCDFTGPKLVAISYSRLLKRPKACGLEYKPVLDSYIESEVKGRKIFVSGMKLDAIRHGGKLNQYRLNRAMCGFFNTARPDYICSDGQLGVSLAALVAGTVLGIPCMGFYDSFYSLDVNNAEDKAIGVGKVGVYSLILAQAYILKASLKWE